MSSKKYATGNPKNLQNNKNTKNYKIQNNITQDKTNIWLLLPIIFSMSVLPFIMRLKEYNTNLSGFSWFTFIEESDDTFLIYKQKFFLIITFTMIIILLIKFCIDRRELYYSHILIPLAVYVILAFLSSLLSEYRKFSFSGIHEHFESFFVLLGYCLLVYYASVYVKTEKDLELIINCFVVSIIIMGLLALSQYLGKDFFRTKLGLSLILPKKYLKDLSSVSFKFENNRVYLTLYNPNYVGSYVALTTPLLATLALLTKKKYWKLPLYIIAIAGSLIALIGSKSKTAIIALLATGLLGVIIFSKKLIKYFYLSIPAFLFVICSIILYNRANDNILSYQLRQAINIQKSEVALQDIKTLDDEIVITYNNNNMHIKLISDHNYAFFDVTDDFNNNILLNQMEEYYSFTVQDERFPGFEIGLATFDNEPCFYVRIDGHDWYFTNITEDGSYYLINIYGKKDKIEKAPSALFTGYEKYASGRGYIWSRTLPLLKKYLVFGSGADTFQLVFPMRDYVNRYNFGYYDQIITKPHNMYLQMGVQTGVLSLIAFLVFYGIYFITSFCLYIKESQYKSFYSQAGVAIFLSTFCYMIMGIANDSMIVVAPIFWAMMGLGIAVNTKVKNELKSQI